jgi:chaperonin cofactor prefoldin
MADKIVEEEEILKKQIADLEETTAKLAEKFEELAGIDCDFGECIFDPEMDDVQQRLAEVQRRKKILEGMIQHLEECQT